MGRLSRTEQELIARAAASPMRERTLAWSAINSGTGNLPGLARVADLLADAFGTLPGTLGYVDPTFVERVAPDGEVEPLAHGRHLHLRVRPDAPVQMLFTGHMDTVYPADHPFQSVRTLPDGRINGPGVADMKGGLAIMLAALEAVERSSLSSRLGYEVVINADEETGSFSSAALIERACRGKVAALTFEPALADGTLAGARGGTGNFSLVVRGRSAHAGRNPEDGRNALVAAADLAVRLRNAAGPRLGVNPARIDGGGPNNVVPDLAILRVNFRPATLDDVERASTHLRSAVNMVAAEHEVEITSHGSFNRSPKPSSDKIKALQDMVAAAGAALDVSVGFAATGGVCDGNNIAACGVPVVDTMGARGGAIHSADEYLIPESLPERAQLAALTIVRIVEKGAP
ncbi:glutamate carboxypeptidase [Sphingomonas guangdongensis]|uniref:Glutamate carboxypeptidase n=1 Tax=Sphingomonas guangdongensis TaxID=1141890 RepID=A0A285QZD9_9SPHN|nr:hydrolase [Sphingomonas guangdongensis]SOB87253.1 glutamate carboxypeptidase [Sphingomonas guangdongensis]